MSARHCFRTLSPSLKRMCTGESPPFVASFQTSAGRQAEKPKKPQSPSDSKISGATAESSSPPGQKQAASDNDTYSSGKEFFGHNAYSFYDFEVDMEKNRIVQPSSEKAKSLLSS